MEQIAEMVALAAHEVRSFGLEPKVALLSSSNFGTRDLPSANKMRSAVDLRRQRYPDLEVEGEMHADAAISESIRNRVFPNSRLSGTANLLVMPNLEAANISNNLLQSAGRALAIGPMLVGTSRPMHILTASVTVRGIINMTAVGAVDAQEHDKARTTAG